MFDALSEKLRQQLTSVDKKTVIIATAVSTVIAAIVSGGAYYSPYLTFNNMKNATANRNADALSQEINFPSLRTSIKENITAQVLKQLSGAEASAGLPKITPAIVEKMVSSKVDKVVTPEGLEQLMLDKIPGTKIDLSHLEQDIAKSDINMGYESFDRFVIHIIDKANRTKDVSLILRRDGLAWKLAAINTSNLFDS
jgi:hypothetical protein